MRRPVKGRLKGFGVSPMNVNGGRLVGRAPRGNVYAFQLLQILLLLMAGACSAQNGSLSPEARRDYEVRPGVVKIKIQIAAGGTKCGIGVSGTGFLYRPDGYLITNGHVAQMANAKDEAALHEQRIAVFSACYQPIFEHKLGRHLTDAEVEGLSRGVHVQSALTVYLDNGNHYDGDIKAYSDPITSGGKDVAVIKIDANNLPTVPLGNSDGLNVNDHIYSVGYPGLANVSRASELVATSSDGTISALKNQDYSGTPLIQTNTNINHGNSGGPAFDGAGQVIGIATFGKTEPGYNFLVPISTAREFVRQAGAEPERGAFDKKWHDALDAFSNEEWSTAHSLLNDVLEMMPNQPEAQRLQLQAAKFQDAESTLHKMQVKIGLRGLVAIAALLILISGVLLWVALRKPGAAAPRSASAARVSLEPAGSPPGTRVIESSSGSGAPQESFGTLHVSGGSLTGNRFPIPKAGLLIGRDPAKCSVVLADDSISREHAWVVPLDNGVAVIDRNSANGTFVNSVDSPRINKVILRHGDRVYLGKKNGAIFTYYSA